METETLLALKQLGPWGMVLGLAVVYVVREYLSWRKPEENKLQPILDKLEELEKLINKIMLDNEKKVTYDHLESKYMTRDVVTIMVDNMKDSLKRAHERIDAIEKEK